MRTVIVRLFDAADDTLGPLHGVVEVPGGEQRAFDDGASLVAAVLALGRRRPGHGGTAEDGHVPAASDHGDRTPEIAHRTVQPLRDAPDVRP